MSEELLNLRKERAKDVFELVKQGHAYEAGAVKSAVPPSELTGAPKLYLASARELSWFKYSNPDITPGKGRDNTTPAAQYSITAAGTPERLVVTYRTRYYFVAPKRPDPVHIYTYYTASGAVDLPTIEGPAK